MGKPDFIFDLIQSLSKSEKRHFKLFASRYKHEGEKKYMSIFRRLEKPRGKDSLAIDLHNNESDSRNLAADKHYLSEMLLSSLRQFHSGSSIQMRLCNELLSIELLRQKGLFIHALRRLLRVKKEAIRYELPELVVRLIAVETEIRSTGVIEWPAISKQLSEEMKTWLRYQMHLTDLNQLRIDQLQSSVEKGRPMNAEEREAWIKRLKYFDPEISLTGLATEKSIRLRAHSHVFFVLRDIPSANEVNVKQYELFCNHPELIEKSPVDYLAFLFRYVSTSVQLKKYVQAGHLLAQISNIRKKEDESSSSESAVFIDERLLSTELYFYGKSGRYDLMRAKTDEAEKFIRKSESNQNAVIGFNMSVAFLFSGEYRKVIHWSYRALAYPDLKRNYILFLASNLHQLIAHIELNDIDAALSRGNSARRFVVLRKDQEGSADLELINTLCRCGATDQLNERKEIAFSFLKQYEKNKDFMQTDEYVAIIHWLSQLAEYPVHGRQ